jgi:hypothetical protein
MSVTRAALVFFGVTLFALAVGFAALGEPRFALSCALLSAGALLMATWAWGYPTAFPVRQWVALGILAVGLVVAGLVWVAVAFVAVLVLINLASSGLVLRRLERVEFEETGADAVTAAARPVVVEFESEGFQRVGGYRARIPLIRKVVTAMVLRSSEGDCFAVVTDRVWEVVSRYGSRWLITTSSGLVPLPGHMLRQALPRGRPADLVQAHRDGVSVLEGRGLEADQLADDDVLGAARALEGQAVAHAAQAPLRRAASIETRRASDDPTLAGDDNSPRRIDDWLAADVPT